MIISKTPLRLSFFGGSTDVYDFFKEHSSLVIGCAINKYVYLAVRYTPPILPYKTLINYSCTEQVDDNSCIKHDGARGVLDFLNIQEGIEISNLIDVPARTGTGSSSAYVVGLLNAIYQLTHNEPASKFMLAKNAIYIERELLQEPGGIQDQLWSSFGGLNSIHIDKNGEYKIRPLPICHAFINEFNQNLVLFYTGNQRNSFKIAKSHNTNAAKKYKLEIKQIAEEALKAFANEDIDEIGRLLDMSWQNKRQMSSLISTKKIDDLYNSVKHHGALGCKLLGSGGGGFLVCITNDRHKLIRNMDLKHIDFTFDFEGSKIILT